jgi:hypothetical protein
MTSQETKPAEWQPWYVHNPATVDGTPSEPYTIYDGGTTKQTFIIIYDSGVIQKHPAKPSVKIEFIQDGLMKSASIDIGKPTSITATLVKVLTYHAQAEARGRWQLVCPK